MALVSFTYVLFLCKKFYRKKTTHKKNIYTLITPFIIVQCIHLAQVIFKLLIDPDYEIPSHFGRGLYVFIEFFSVFFNVLLIVLTYRMITQHENNKLHSINWVKSETNWLKKLIYIGLITCFFWLVGITIIIVKDLNKSYVFYPMWIGISVLVYWIGYVGTQKSRQLKERIEIRKKNIEVYSKAKERKVLKKQSFKTIEHIIISERLYLNPNLKLNDLAGKLNLSEGYISQLFSSQSKSFNEYINILRINESLKMLKDQSFNSYTITSIGLESGFNSKSSFYTAFKKHIGKTTNAYKKLVQDM